MAQTFVNGQGQQNETHPQGFVQLCGIYISGWSSGSAATTTAAMICKVFKRISAKKHDDIRI
jgi:hypothetical protein